MKSLASLLICILVIVTSACDENTSPTTFDGESGVEILFGIGNEISMARETPLFNEAPIKMISSWFSKPEDHEWMRYYVERNTMSELYSKGYAQELIGWTIIRSMQ